MLKLKSFLIADIFAAKNKGNEGQNINGREFLFQLWRWGRELSHTERLKSEKVMALLCLNDRT